MPLAFVIATVFVPFAAGYYLSYVFRTINAVIADNLAAEFVLGPAELGTMTSVYFLAFVAVQLPAGVALDRYGPRRVQSVLLFVAAVGSLMFAAASDVIGLIVGRMLIGIGVAGALMAGLKAIVLWVPPQRVALANGWFIMLGALGAVTATAPAEALIQHVGWRGLFLMLATLCVVSAVMIYLAVPERQTPAKSVGLQSIDLWTVFSDARFWRIAPLSAAVVAASWSLQGLWAAPWLIDVEGLSRAQVVSHLLMMAVALSAGSLGIGMAAHRLRRRGASPLSLLATIGALSILAQVAIILRSPVPIMLPWAVVAIAGAATVLSFASIAELFPKELSGRANAALNLLHVGGAFAMQCATGFIVQLWPMHEGQHSIVAYQAAFAAGVALQVAALAWFQLARKRMVPPVFAPHAVHHGSACHRSRFRGASAYDCAIECWMERMCAARAQVAAWRLAAIGSVILALTLSISAVEAMANTGAARVHVVTNVGSANSGMDNSIAAHLLNHTETAALRQQGVGTDHQAMSPRETRHRDFGQTP